MPQHADWQEVGAEEKPMPTPDLSDLARLGGKMDLISGTGKFSPF